MVTAVFGIVLFAALLQMVALGAVLLVRFVLGGQSRTRRVFAAAVGAPLVILAPTFAMISVDQGQFDGEQAIGFALTLGVGALIAWPVAHFATRRLDRLTRFDPQVFE
ncbi:MAG: hypothetical protein GC147_01635 [Porphyrobacter sp.]|nr:hypothetical protein [Porphyrobacter sp.]